MQYTYDEEQNINQLIDDILNERDTSFGWQCPVAEVEQNTETQQPEIPKEKEYICNLIKSIKEKCDVIQTNILNSPLDDKHYFTIELMNVENHLTSINDYASMMSNIKNNIGANIPGGTEVTKIFTGDIRL